MNKLRHEKMDLKVIQETKILGEKS